MERQHTIVLSAQEKDCVLVECASRVVLFQDMVGKVFAAKKRTVHGTVASGVLCTNADKAWMAKQMLS